MPRRTQNAQEAQEHGEKQEERRRHRSRRKSRSRSRSRSWPRITQDAQEAMPDIPLTAVEAEVIKLYKEAASETKNDPLYVRCTAEHRGVGDGDGMIVASCLFSFKIHRDVSKERRTQILQCLFDDMTSRVDEAFSVAGDP